MLHTLFASRAPEGWKHASRTLLLRGFYRAAVVIVLSAGSNPALAGDSLMQAMTSAYANHPALDAERARLRATDEGVAQAKSGWRPRIEGRAGYTLERTRTSPDVGADADNRNMGYGLTVSQTLFDGFRTSSAVSEAEARVREGRAVLRAREAEVLLQAVTAYMDVVRDRQLVRLNRNNVAVLARELNAALERRRVKEVTVTDVAQARARHARAMSALDEARGNLKASRAEYERVVGHQPRGVRMPPIKLRLVPRSLEDAIAFALRGSPRIHRALYREAAARHQVARVNGELLPQVRLEARYSQQYDSVGTVSRTEEATVGGRVTIPIYSGGETRARIRSAKHRHVGRIQEIADARRTVRSRVTAAWSRMMARKARIASDRVQVKASETALQGVREEQRVGARTLLDVLNAEQEVLEAKASLVRTERDMVVAQHSLLSEMGRLDADLLSLPTAIYDADVHYREAKGKWLTTAIAQPLPKIGKDAAVSKARQAWKLKPAIEPEPAAPPYRPQSVTTLRGAKQPPARAAGEPLRIRVFPGSRGSNTPVSRDPASGATLRPKLKSSGRTSSASTSGAAATAKSQTDAAPASRSMVFPGDGLRTSTY